MRGETDKIKPQTLEMTELSQKTLEMTVELRQWEKGGGMQTKWDNGIQ